MFVSGPHVTQAGPKLVVKPRGLNVSLYLLSTAVTGVHHDRPVDVVWGRGNGLCVRLALYHLTYRPRHLQRLYSHKTSLSSPLWE